MNESMGHATSRSIAAHERYRPIDVPLAGGDLHVGVWEASTFHPKGTLLAIHGITGTHLSWQWLAEELTDWRIIAPDLRGRGRSNSLGEPFGMVRHADDLAVALAAAGMPEPVTVIGHSMGGYVALVLAHRHPERVRRLFLVDGGIPVQLPEGVRPEDALTAVLGPTAERLNKTFASLEEVDTLWQRHPGLQGQWGPELAAYAEYDLRGEEPELRPSTRYEAMAQDSADIQLGDVLSAAMEALAHPAVFLRAERGMQNQPGGLFTSEWAAEWAARMPGLEVRDLPETNHFTAVMSEFGSRLLAAEIR